MLQVTLFCFLILSSHALVPNEEYRCDVPCEQSCETLNAMFPCNGDRVCRNFCLPGYVRDNRRGSCIAPYECPSCFGNETYKSEGIDCLTCENYKITECALLYESKCYCLDGYVRNDLGQCVSILDCSTKGNKCIKPNERFTSCFMKACERTCENKGIGRHCPRICKTGGCRCRWGFIRDENSGECIRENSCPRNYK